jgi:hypothetical protein
LLACLAHRGRAQHSLSLTSGRMCRESSRAQAIPSKKGISYDTARLFNPVLVTVLDDSKSAFLNHLSLVFTHTNGGTTAPY